MNTWQFNPEKYGHIFSDLIDPERLNELGSGQANNILRDKIKSINLKQAFEPEQIRDTAYANACLSGIWLHNDYLDESHVISQNIVTTSGSFWHGIMHRREGDYWNSKYWFRQVGEHPVFETLQSATLHIANSLDIPEFKQKSWDPFLFIDLVEKYIDTNSDLETIFKKIQRIEWQLLFDHCYQQAIGKN